MAQDYVFPSFSEKDRKYPLYVLSVGKMQKQTPINRPVGTPRYLLHFTLGGSGEVVMNGKKIPIQKNSVMFFKPNASQFYYPTGEGWEVVWVSYQHNGFLDALSVDTGIYNLSDIEPFVKFISKIFENEGTLNFGKNASVILYNLLLELEEQLHHENFAEIKSVIRPAVKFIEQNYKMNFESPYLAELCHVSYGHFCRSFKKNYNMRPLEYVRKLRIQESKRLLISKPDMTVEEISEAVGYTSPSYFIKNFKEVEKITPTQFRKQEL